MSSTSDEGSVVQGNNLLQGYKEVDNTEINTNKESNEREANTEEHGVGQEKQASHERKFFQVSNESSYSLKRIHMVWVQIWRRCLLFHM